MEGKKDNQSTALHVVDGNENAVERVSSQILCMKSEFCGNSFGEKFTYISINVTQRALFYWPMCSREHYGMSGHTILSILSDYGMMLGWMLFVVVFISHAPNISFHF